MEHLNSFVSMMETEGINKKTIQIFSHYYNQCINGETGKLSREQVRAPEQSQVLEYESLSQTNPDNLKKLAIIKLNGGLGTSMGLSKAKSLLPVKNNETFLDIIAKQTIKLRKLYHIELPLIFMNSFNTSEDTCDFLKKYPDLAISGLPLDFLQNMFPKVRKVDMKPLKCFHKSQNWNPPGHGDIYNALSDTGLLQKLLDRGFEYIFVSNSDNLGAIVDPAILNRLFDEKIDFAMEVCRRTDMDKKGGHLAKTPTGGLMLREIAQCPEDEIDEFQNINIFKYFNTNNLWINLEALHKKLVLYDGVLPLPLILNKKEVEKTPVYQFETAMGSAISIFDNSKAIFVPRNRFLPVKKCQDLLLLWSDGYELNKDFVLEKKEGSRDTVLELDNDCYGNIDQLKKACENGVPSLYDCEELKIDGFIKFKKDEVFTGKVFIKATENKF